MGTHLDAEIAHHLQENVATRHRPVIHVDHQRDALKREGLVVLWPHRVEQKAQSRFDIFAVDTAIFLVRHPAAIIDDTEEHQRRRFLVMAHPRGSLDVLEV